jgi:exonuclease VII small subunit
MDGHIVGSMISANSITGEQIQANSIKTANLELSAQKKIESATDEETVKALIKADLDGFESTLSKEFITVENATTQIQQATEVAVKEATQNIIDNAVSESMGAVDGQLNDKLNQYTGNTLLPTINEKAEEVLQNAEDYVVTKLESYATKQELSSSISQTRDQIELSVSEKYTTKAESVTIVTEAIDGIAIGGTNLWVISDLVDGWESNGDITGSGSQYKTRQSLIENNGATTLIYQCWNPNGIVNTNNSNRVSAYDENGTWLGSADVAMLSGDKYQIQYIEIAPLAKYIRLGAICGADGGGYDNSIKIKFELGNKPTDYSLAPEDVESKFTVIESETRTLKESVTSLQLGTDSINASVKSLQETVTNTTNSLAQDIQSVQNQVNLAMTSDDVKIEIQKEMSKGTNKVSTSTGFTFDDNGLKVSKSDSEMSTQITEDGMKVYRNNEVVLTANNQGVDAKNLHATTYLIIGNNSRMEDFSEDGGKRTAMFWIGD